MGEGLDGIWQYLVSFVYKKLKKITLKKSFNKYLIKSCYSFASVV